MRDRKKIWMIAIAGITWFALVLQLYLMLTGPAASTLGTVNTIINFFSYFTILSNLMVAVSLTVSSVSPASAAGKFFSKITVCSAIALYIFIVGLVYNLVLRNLWKPEGWQLVADNLLHVIVPLFYVIFWILFTPKKSLGWMNILPWLIFPAVYLAYSLLRGASTGWYPYPFINADQLGYGKVVINSLLVLTAIVVFGLAIVGFNRYGKQKTE
ncbi:MAG: Pr6Pr family membrane protein [Chitinophagaceae bacterium]|nr:Pr6Pr family membrane protein [Chitinophagaceae bacterium]